MEWVEVTGSTVEIAVEAALEELGIDSVENAEVEVLQEATGGFLGMGSRPAIVKVVRAPSRSKRRRRRGGSSGQPQQHTQNQQKKRQQKQSQQKETKAQAAKSGQRSQRRPAKQDGKGRAMENGEAGNKRERPEPAPIEEQAKVATAFLDGLLNAFGLEGETTSRIEDDVLYLDVVGDQTEALVGAKGAAMYSVLELTRTTVQRKTFGAPRMRIDIAGYGARRREALTIYTHRLAEQVVAERGEVMLEPMNAADRKVVHDAAGEIEGVRTHSEGEDPRRAVVISPVDGETG
jgi:spoIIIJ-associated protein